MTDVFLVPSRSNKFSAGLLTAALLITSAGTANALAVNTTIDLLDIGPGFSQSNQVGGGDLSNADGAAAEVDFSFTRTAALAGKLSVNLSNVGNGFISNFGISLRDDIFGAPGSSGVTGAAPFLSNVSCLLNGCNMVNGIDSNLSAFMNNHLQAGATRATGSAASTTLGALESVTFNWNVVFSTAQAAVLDSVVTFLDLVSPQAAHGVTGSPFNTFWAVHVQGLADDRSDRLGGSTLPEPGALSLLGIGVAGLYLVARRRRIARTQAG